MKRIHLTGIGLILFFFAFRAWAGASPDMVIMVLDQNAYVVEQAVQGLDTNLGLDVRVVTVDDVTHGPKAVRALTKAAPVIVVDVMGRELALFMADNKDLGSKTVYALRGSLDDGSLKKKRAGV